MNARNLAKVMNAVQYEWAELWKCFVRKSLFMCVLGKLRCALKFPYIPEKILLLLYEPWIILRLLYSTPPTSYGIYKLYPTRLYSMDIGHVV